MSASASPSQLLAALLEQHARLRVMMDRCEQLADQLDAGVVQPAELTREVVELRGAFDAHNRFEEELLQPMLRELDAFADVRIEHMVEDHVHEHRSIRDHLDGPTAELRGSLYELRAHLAAEERYFVTARVLRDDVITVEAGG